MKVYSECSKQNYQEISIGKLMKMVYVSQGFTMNFKLYTTPETVKVIKAGRLRWLAHHSRMQEQNSRKQLMFQKSQDTRQLGRPPMRWLVSEWALDTGSQVTRLGPMEGNGKGS
jgi:hypothetical protein